MKTRYDKTQNKKLKDQLKQCKIDIENMLKLFKYQDNISRNQNIQKLCTSLKNIIHFDHFDHFLQFINNQQNLPIQFNLRQYFILSRTLRYENLTQIFQDWLNSYEENVVYSEKITINFRNTLFKKVFMQGKETIKDYFQTLSEQQIIKDINLFQLLTQLLRSYYLYEFNSDIQQFFEKTNSFQRFMKVIEAFSKSTQRKETCKASDGNYIKLDEFEQLILFWQNLNTELTLQQQQRQNTHEVSCQTVQICQLIDEQTQTHKQGPKSYLNFINGILLQVNNMISKQNDPQMLSSLDILFDVLRSQKMFAITYDDKQRLKQKKLQINQHIFNSDLQQTQVIITNGRKKGTSPKKNIISNHKDMGYSSFINKNDQILKNVYKYLCTKDQLHCLNLTELRIFFYQIGLIKSDDNSLINNLLTYGYIQDKDEITLRQFIILIKQLMKESKKLTIGILKNYMNNIQDQQQIQKTVKIKNNQNKLLILEDKFHDSLFL